VFGQANAPHEPGETIENDMSDHFRSSRCGVSLTPAESSRPADTVFLATPSRIQAAMVGGGIALLVTLCAGAAQAASGGDDHNPVMEAVWQGVNLVIILGVLVYFGRAPIQAYFASRRATIKNELTEAADLLTQAEQRNAELQRRLVDLNSELEGIREAAHSRAEDEAEKILADARASAERIRNDAKAAAAQELSRAQSELRKEAANIAMDLAAQKLSQNVADSDRERLMDEFITRVEPTSDTRPGEGAS
jgi:F-type H+-transporting ATPase subunit b